MRSPAVATERAGLTDDRRQRLTDLSKRIRALEERIEFHDTDEWIKAVTNITGLNLRHEILGDALMADDPREWDALCRTMDEECQQFERAFLQRHPDAARAAPQPVPETPAATRERYDAAMRDPRAVFGAPNDVVVDTQFTIRQKLEVLKRWEADARELSVAEDENMTGGEPNRLREVLLAIMKLKPSDPDAKTAPTKQGG